MQITDKITITNECNMQLMARYPDGYFDLAIVDPPYGINAPNMKMGAGAKSRGGRSSTAFDLKKGRLNQGSGKLKNRILNNSKITWDNETPNNEYFTELFRVSKNVIIWGGNYFDLPPTRCIICWDKCQPWENFSQWEMAWTSFDKPAALVRISNSGRGNHDKKIHPTQKPVVLYKWILDKYGMGGGKIIDTHLGSGSIAIACHDYGFELVACELDPDYYNQAIKRIKDHTSQQSLFSL